jgi:CDP-glucose 4,6-dehydratase
MESVAMKESGQQHFWRGKQVLVTGHSGFKGSWLTVWLNLLGANVTGISLAPSTTPNLCSEVKIDSLCDSHFCDIRDASKLARIIYDVRPEIVFHLAAQALVRASYEYPRDTFETNVMGTTHLLEALRGLETVRVALMVTTDKVYRQSGSRVPFREDDPLGGRDPYSASKACCELVVESYRHSFFKEQGLSIACARAGNVIGGGDWAMDRLIPDAIRAWEAGLPLHVRRPESIRPWQHVLEPLSGYLTLAEELWGNSELADAYNFGPDEASTVTVRDVVQLARAAYGRGDAVFCENPEGQYEAEWLALNTDRTRESLGIKARLTIAEAVANTVAWYKAHKNGADARSLCKSDIASYEALQ